MKTLRRYPEGSPVCSTLPEPDRAKLCPVEMCDNLSTPSPKFMPARREPNARA